jgi:hypothetical protein
VRGEVELKEQAIANLNSEIKTLTGENKTLVADLLECRPALESVRDELKEREQAIANLKAELEVRENKQLTLFPGQDITPEQPPEPKTKAKSKSKAKSKPEPTPETKLLNPRQLAEWINNNCNPEKPVTDQNPRDWFNKKSTCTNEYRAEMQEKYGFKFSHQDSKGTCWFAIPE